MKRAREKDELPSKLPKKEYNESGFKIALPTTASDIIGSGSSLAVELTLSVWLRFMYGSHLTPMKPNLTSKYATDS